MNQSPSDQIIKSRIQKVLPHLDERQRRIYLESVHKLQILVFHIFDIIIECLSLGYENEII